MSRSLGRASISTSTFSKSFLAKAWDARKELLDYEKRGFAQFFYLTLCSHIESELAFTITRRLHFISRIVRWEDIPLMKWKNQEIEQECPLDPIIQSLKQITRRLEADVESAPLSKLIELFGRVFPESLRVILGPELFDDMDSLATLRNIFAHGRNLTMEFEGEDWSSLKGTLDGNALKKPAERLYRAGVIKGFDINGANYNDFHASFYCDDAMLYFYKAAQSIETQLESFTPFPPERSWVVQTKLPPLDP